MKHIVGEWDSFFSPITGELATFRQIPQADNGEILQAGVDGFFEPSLGLIDAKIDINFLKKLTDGFKESKVILQTPSSFFPNAQALDGLANGILVKGDNGVLSTTTIPEPPPLVLNLPKGQLYIGNDDNIATPTQTISMDNFPNLGVANIAGAELPLGRIWRGTQDNRPEESDALSLCEVDIGLINGRFVFTNFILGSALVKYTYPRAQYLDTITPGLPLATEGPKLVIAPLAPDMVWRGSAEGVPTEAPYVSAEELEELVDQARGYAEAAESSAGEAATSAGEAATAVTTISGLVTEFTEVTLPLAIGAAGTATAAAAAAATSAGLADGYKNDAKNYLDQLLATGLNDLTCTEDVDLKGFKIINLAPPADLSHAVNLETLRDAIDNIPPPEPVELEGFVETTTTTDGVTQTIAGPLAKLNLIPADDDVSFSNHRITDLAYLPEDENDGVSALFLWDLLNNRIDDMLLRTQVDPVLSVPDSSQSFTYSNQQENASFQLKSLFSPTSPTIPSNLKFDLLNFASKGFRSGVLTKNDNSTPTYLFSSVAPSGTEENATLVSSPLLTFNENQNNQFKSYFNIFCDVVPTDNKHLVNKGWVNAQIAAIPAPGTPTLSLTGPVSCTANSPLSSSITTTFNLKLWQITNNGDVSLSNYRLKDVIDPQVAQDASTKNYTDTRDNAVTSSLTTYINNKTWTTSSITNFDAAVGAFRLDQLTTPTTDLSMGNNKLINVKDPVGNQDAANKQWVNAQIAAIPSPGSPSITLTGGVTGTGPLSASVATTLNSSAVTTIAKTVALNLFAVPTADVDFNSKKLLNVATPTSSTHGANMQYVVSLVTSLFSYGDFTPSIVDEGGNDVIGNSSFGGQGYTVRRGTYLKFYNWVFMSICFIFSGGQYTDTPSITKNLYLTGLPFQPNLGDFNIMPIGYLSLALNNNVMQLFVNMTNISSFPIMCQYVDTGSSTYNDPKILTRSMINKMYNASAYPYRTVLTMNWVYRTT